MSVVPASVLIRGGFGWAILACGAPKDSPITTTSPPAGGLDLRVEQVRTGLAAQKGQHCPVCTGGRRAGPPQDCGGVQAFLENTQPHHVLAAAIRAAEILGMLLDDEDVPRFG